jgi:uncharacterized protein YecT (DUF1311 family)
MKNLFFLILAFASILMAYIPESFIHQFKNKTITYSQLINKMIFTEGMDKDKIPINPIEAEFYQNHYNDKRVVLNLKNINLKRITPLKNGDFQVIAYLRDFYVFGMIFDKNATLKSSVLLKYRAGNNEYQIKRHVKQTGPFTFIITDTVMNTNWIEFPVKGFLVLDDIKKFKITAKNGKFQIEKLSIKNEFKKTDKELNKIYKTVLSKLPKEKKTALRKIQRDWIRFVYKNCEFLSDNYENKNIAEYKKFECLNNYTKNRIKELKKFIPAY